MGSATREAMAGSKAALAELGRAELPVAEGVRTRPRGGVGAGLGLEFHLFRDRHPGTVDEVVLRDRVRALTHGTQRRAPST